MAKAEAKPEAQSEAKPANWGRRRDDTEAKPEAKSEAKTANWGRRRDETRRHRH